MGHSSSADLSHPFVNSTSSFPAVTQPLHLRRLFLSFHCVPLKDSLGSPPSQAPQSFIVVVQQGRLVSHKAATSKPDVTVLPPLRTSGFARATGRHAWIGPAWKRCVVTSRSVDPPGPRGSRVRRDERSGPGSVRCLLVTRGLVRRASLVLLLLHLRLPPPDPPPHPVLGGNTLSSQK